MGAPSAELAAALGEALASENDDRACLALLDAARHLGKSAKPIVPLVVAKFSSDNPAVRQTAVKTFGQIATELDLSDTPSSAVPALRSLLGDSYSGTRGLAAYALEKLGPAARTTIPDLITLTGDVDEFVRMASLMSLAELRAESVEATGAAINRLRSDPSVMIRREAAFLMIALYKGDPTAATHALTAALTDPDYEVTARSAVSLSYVPAKVTEALLGPILSLIHHPQLHVKMAALYALSNLRAAARAALPELLIAAQDRSLPPQVSAQAIIAVADIGEPADTVHTIATLSHDDRSQIRGAAATALGLIGPSAASESLPLLTGLLSDTVPDVRSRAIEATGLLGSRAKTTIPRLLYAINDSDTRVRDMAARTLESLANSVRDAGDVSALDLLARMQHELEQNQKFEVRSHINGVRRAREYLELNWWIQMRRAIGNFYGAYPVSCWTMLGAALWACAVSLVYWLAPLMLVRLSGALEPLAVELPQWAGGVKLRVRSVTLIRFFASRPRVLDAWITRHIASAAVRFEMIRAAADNKVHVEIPVVLDGKPLSGQTAEEIRLAFSSRVVNCVICGEGGIGKTALACALARRAMADDPRTRLAGHRMVPIWLDEELRGGEENTLVEAILNNLRILIDSPEPLSRELLFDLLRHKRLLVIVDRFSELPQQTRNIVLHGRHQCALNALILTSRAQIAFPIATVAIEPLRIMGNRLSFFLSAYLAAIGTRELLDDAQFFECCARLSRMVGGKSATVLLAKLYAEQIAGPKPHSQSAGSVDSVPELFLQYLNVLNRGLVDGKEDDEAVQSDAKRLAWECTRSSLLPGEITWRQAVESLDCGDAASRINYLEGKLRILTKVGPEFRIRFTLDPLAEYLAALYVVQGCVGGNGWMEICRRTMADGLPGNGYSGFLSALSDCLCTPRLVNLPEHLSERIRRWTESASENQPQASTRE
jgi:HEAT repeat protein